MALLLLSLSILSSFTVSAAETAFIPEEGTFMLKNLGSGKYLNVDNGIDTDGTNVYQWSSDGSIEQKFKFEYESGSWYRIQAVCSSNGNNRCLSISGATTTVSNNSNVVINAANNDIAQHFTIHSAGAKTVVLKPRYNSNLALTAYGLSNGSATGTTSSSAGNVFVSSYSSSNNYQKWVLEPVLASLTIPEGSYYITTLDMMFLSPSGAYQIVTDYTGSVLQEWTLIHVGNGFYELQNPRMPEWRLTAITDTNASTTVLAERTGGIEQQFKFVPSGNWSYRIVPAISIDKALTIEDVGDTNDSRLKLGTYTGHVDQLWYPILLDSTSDEQGGRDWEWVLPNNSWTNISSGYKDPNRTDDHFAIDLNSGSFGVINGQNIIAPCDARVHYRNEYFGSGGNYVVLEIENYLFPQDDKIYVGFMHMQAGSCTLAEDDTVKKGDVIGRVGQTGTNAPHLHLCVWIDPEGEAHQPTATLSINPQRLFPLLNFTGATSNLP